MIDKIEPDQQMVDEGIGQFLALARSANFYFDLVNNHLTVRAVNPNWTQWKPIRHFLDEIGSARLESYLRRLH